jgi:transcriptional regulator with XRE-family HTH domain
MKERLLEFLRAENKSSAQLAEEIGVQPSGISHILSGRNNPSLDFVMKMINKYPYLSSDWLLFGKGSMYKDQRLQTLFDEDMYVQRNADQKAVSEAVNPVPDTRAADRNQSIMKESLPDERHSSVVRIVWFYDDNSFEEFLPRN